MLFRSSAPTSGSGNIQVRFNYAQQVSYNVINGANILGGTITESKIADGAVTDAKLSARILPNMLMLSGM